MHALPVCANLHRHVRWWLDAGTLMGAHRGHEFIPWDNDGNGTRPRPLVQSKRCTEISPAVGIAGDVAVLYDDWDELQNYLARVRHAGNDVIPRPKDTPCGCVLIDTASFGSTRHGFDPGTWYASSVAQLDLSKGAQLLFLSQVSPNEHIKSQQHSRQGR